MTNILALPPDALYDNNYHRGAIAAVLRMPHIELNEIIEWCDKVFGGQYNAVTMERFYRVSPSGVIYFYDEKHYMMFLLRWK